MATFLDTTLLEQSSVVFSWVLVFVVVFGVAEAVNLLKNKTLNALLAFTVAMVTTTSNSVQAIISNLTPAFVVIAFFALFLMILANFMGMPTGDIVGAMGGKNAAWYLIVPFMIAVLVGLSSSIGQGLLEERTGDETTTIIDEAGNEVVVTTPHKESVVVTLTNPKVLGMILVIFVGMFTIIFLAGKPPGFA